MDIAPTLLQRTFETTTVLRAHTDRLRIAERGPSWIRVLDAGRATASAAAAMEAATDALVESAPDDGHVLTTVDFLRGAAWHAMRGVDSLRSGVSDVLSGHTELQAQAARLLDPGSAITIPGDFTTFEAAVKSVDPGLLSRIGNVADTVQEPLERTRADIGAARELLRAIARGQRG